MTRATPVDWVAERSLRVADWDRLTPLPASRRAACDGAVHDPTEWAAASFFCAAQFDLAELRAA
jgi:hypothetical protein